MKEIKRLGGKLYSIANKIIECENSGMETRIPAYVKGIEELQVTISKKLEEYKSTENGKV